MNQNAQDRFEVRTATPDAFAIAVKWAQDEGWNPGLGDLDAFFAADPNGFLIGYADGRPVSSISVVRYGDDFGFLGFYIVRPEARGKGYGLTTWKAGMEYLGSRTVGLDGVVAQQDNYRKSGFRLVGRNIRFSGVPRIVAGATAVEIAEVEAGHAGQIGKLDQACFGTPRADFLKAWVYAAPGAGRKSFAAFENGDLEGFATIRKCVDGYKIGPLFAQARQTAEALFQACCAHAEAGSTVVLDVPEMNVPATKMAEHAGLAPLFETARMYRGPAPELPWSNIFGVTTFELG